MGIQNDNSNKNTENYQAISPVRHSVAAVISSITATVLVHPLDVVKTRLQVQDRQHQLYTGVVDALRKIGKKEGIKGLYAGITPSLLGNSVSWGLYFGCYRFFQRDRKSFFDQSRAAAASGIITVFLTNPIWLIKNRMQLQQRNSVDSGTNYKSTWDAVKVISKEEGFRGLYKGVGLSLLNNIHGVIQLVTYEQLRLFVINNMGSDREKQSLSFFYAITTAACSKVLSQLVTYPITTVRTRVQQRPGHGLRYSSTFDAVRSMWKNEGVRGFYRGALVATLRVLPHSTITYALMEQILYSNFWR